MTLTRMRASQGVTLLELMFAVAIFAAAIGATAQCLVSFYANMDVQRQRVIATNMCRATLSDMRGLRDTYPNTTTLPTNFQTHVLAQFPDNTEITGSSLLPGSRIKVTYEDPNATANPLVPTVRVQWTDLRGHDVSATVTSALTDR
jgi:prepilin-type N-terminal cleavage/methylation domain-containing protein